MVAVSCATSMRTVYLAIVLVVGDIGTDLAGMLHSVHYSKQMKQPIK